MGRFLRPDIQNYAAEYGLPDNRWYFDNARVGQKLLQVALHRRWLGRIGRAQIDEQQAGSRWRRMIFGKVRHVYRSANKGQVRKRSPVQATRALSRVGATRGTAPSTKIRRADGR